MLAYGAATRIQVPSLGYTLIRLQLVHGDVSQTSTRHFGRVQLHDLWGTCSPVGSNLAVCDEHFNDSCA